MILFGSVAAGSPSREDFDIDLALDGGDSGIAMDIADESEFEVDIVSLDLLPEGMRRMVEARGVELWRGPPTEAEKISMGHEGSYP